MNYNLNKLTDELRAAGLSGDCASDGRVDLGPGWSFRPGQVPANATEKAAADVLAAHDPTPTVAQKLERDAILVVAARRAALEELRQALVTAAKPTVRLDAEIARVDQALAAWAGRF